MERCPSYRANSSFGVALKSDAFTVRLGSEPGGGSSLLADSERARILLEASGRGRAGEGGVFGSAVEVGVRHDGGDAETGTGLGAGGGLEHARSRAGLRVEASSTLRSTHYAFAAFGDRLAMAPFVRLRTDGAAAGRSPRVGWRFVVTESARLAPEVDVMPADAGGTRGGGGSRSARR